MAKDKIAILVLGMHRSGTSALARALNIFGADLGDANLFAPHATDNPTGYWEHQELLELNDRILAAYGTDYLVRADLPGDWLESKAIASFSRELNHLLGKLFEGKKLVVLKDPRLCFLAPLYFLALHGLGFRCVAIHPLRPPAEVAASLYKRHSGGSLLEYEVIWARTVLAAEAASRAYPRIFTTYEMLLGDPASIYDATRRRLQIRWPVTEKQAQQRLGKFLDKSLHRSRSVAASNYAPIEALHSRLLGLAARECESADLRYFDQWPKKNLFLYPLLERSRAALLQGGEERKALAEQLEKIRAEGEVLRGEVEAGRAAERKGGEERKALAEQLEKIRAEGEVLRGEVEAGRAALLKGGEERRALAEQLEKSRAEGEVLREKLEVSERHKVLISEESVKLLTRYREQRTALHEARGSLEKSKQSASEQSVRCDELQMQVSELSRRRDELQNEVEGLAGRVAQLQADLVAVNASFSWRLTAPARSVLTLLRASKWQQG